MIKKLFYRINIMLETVFDGFDVVVKFQPSGAMKMTNLTLLYFWKNCIFIKQSCSKRSGFVSMQNVLLTASMPEIMSFLINALLFSPFLALCSFTLASSRTSNTKRYRKFSNANFAFLLISIKSLQKFDVNWLQFFFFFNTSCFAYSLN